MDGLYKYSILYPGILIGIRVYDFIDYLFLFSFFPTLTRFVCSVIGALFIFIIESTKKRVRNWDQGQHKMWKRKREFMVFCAYDALHSWNTFHSLTIEQILRWSVKNISSSISFEQMKEAKQRKKKNQNKTSDFHSIYWLSQDRAYYTTKKFQFPRIVFYTSIAILLLSQPDFTFSSNFLFLSYIFRISLELSTIYQKTKPLKDWLGLRSSQSIHSYYIFQFWKVWENRKL